MRPALGFVFDREAGGIRPVWGIAGAARFGEPLEMALRIRAAAVAHDVALIAGEERDKLTVAVRLGGEPALADVAGSSGDVDMLAISPRAKCAVAYSIARKRVQVIGLADGEPGVRREFDVAGAPITSLAVSDDCGAVLAAADSTFLIDSDLRVLPALSGALALAFRPDSRQAAIVTSREIFLMRESGEIARLAEARSGAGVGFSPDGARIVYADRETRKVIAINASDLVSTESECACEPAFLRPLGSGWMLNELSSGPLWVADASEKEPRTFFVPAMSRE